MEKAPELPDPVYIASVISYMRKTHAAIVNKINKEEEEEKKDVERWTEKQLKVIDCFKTWEYGCQHKGVAALVSILTDIPIENLQKPKNFSFNHCSNSFSYVFPGLFVKLIKKPNSYIKAPLNSIVYTLNIPTKSISAGLTPHIHTQPFTEDVQVLNLEDQRWKEFLAIASDSEIEDFITLMNLQVTKGGRWKYFHTLFSFLLPTN